MFHDLSFRWSEATRNLYCANPRFLFPPVIGMTNRELLWIAVFVVWLDQKSKAFPGLLDLFGSFTVEINSNHLLLYASLQLRPRTRLTA